MKELLARFDEINQREKMALGALALFLVVIILWLGVYQPVTGKRADLIRKIANKENELQEVHALAANVRQLMALKEETLARLAAREGADSPLASAEAAAVAAGVREQITAMSPTGAVDRDGYAESLVEVKMKGVSLGSLVRYVEAMTLGDAAARVNRIVISPEFNDPSLLNVSLTFAFFEALS